ncbi:MAG: methionyl-tRNA formyltransferase [Clostridia bacterium]|nr:methionyl-tRNA formyltransferase [Clostridia bacterium]
MKIVFLGTPDFAVPSLNALITAGYEVVAVVTQPDRPVGRKAVLTPSPVKVAALSHGVKVLQFEKISRDGVEELKKLNADIMVTCAFGQILSKEVIDVAPKGIINVHGSLLPKYRGASPVQYAVINGDKIAGVTIMQTDTGIDTGDILAVEKTDVGEKETAGELFERLSKLGAELLLKTLKKIEDGSVVPVKQDEKNATYVKMIKKEDAKIDFSRPAAVVFNLVRGMHPWPIAFTYLRGKLLKIFSCEISHEEYDGAFGEVVRADMKNGIVVKCGVGAIIINELLLEGGSKQNQREFLAGRKIFEGDILG